MLVLLGLLGYLHRQVMTGQLIDLSAKNHLLLTHLMANGLWSNLDQLVHLSTTDPDTLRRHPEMENLRKAVAHYSQDFPLLELKIYNRHGVTLFSTRPEKIGEDQSRNPSFQLALKGGVISELVPDTGTSADGGNADRFMMESYVPLRHGMDQHIEGVFELYQDVTPLMQRINSARWQELLATGCAFLALAGLFGFMIRYLQNALNIHEQNRQAFIQRIQEDKEGLEQRVAERTSELRKTNTALQIEVAVRRQTEVELCLAASVYQNTTEAILVTDAKGVIESVNPAFTTITGYSEEEALHNPVSMLYSNHHDEAFYDFIHHELDTHGKWRGEMWSQRKNGSLYPEFASINAIYDGNGQIMRFVKVFSDLSGIKRSEQQLQFLVHHDSLTGLPNRILLKDRMRQAFSYAQRFNQVVGILFLGLDRFKLINEAVGREVGDQLLREVGVRLGQCLRDEDSLARVGGDEYVILATGLQQGSNASRIAKKLLEALNAPCQIDNERYFLTGSIGISLFPTDEGDEEEHLKKAESAMRQAKDLGGNASHFFTREIDVVSIKRMTIENGLRLALERDELFLHYQPQIHVVTGRLMGVEALIRWKSPELGLVSPVNFIPVAEESDLIIAIGDWVMRTACQQSMRWQEEGFAPIRMAVNLSARQFQQPDLPAKLQQVLRDTGLDPHLLELELTEGMFMRDVSATVNTLHTLKEMDLQLSIDDFGTGYSSLSYLKRFPIHTLKIDRAFVRDIISDPDDAAITRTIIAMAKTLNLQVVAEGVASPDQLEFLRTLGCDLVQGFLFSQPVPPEEIALFLEEDQVYRQQPEFAPKLLSGSGTPLIFPGSSA
ncbi:MAG: EAL domain-containing protein [Magnetococcales bacterium]|nr:EAL domain-containing protein [Magnetococcales bacterium]